MKTKKLNPIFLLSCIFLLSLGCTKNNDTSPIAGDWLIPLLKGELSPVSLTALNNKIFNYTLSADDIGLNTGFPISNPTPTTINNAGAFPIETTDLVESLTLDHGQAALTLTNHFPINIKAGTTISLTTSGSAMPIIRLELAQDLAPGSSQNFSFDLTDKHMNNKLYLNVEKLIIDSFSNKQFDGSELLLNFKFENMTVKDLSIAPQKNYKIQDTVDFNGSAIKYDKYDQMITDSTINATVNFIATNHLPVNVTFQIYFINAATGQLIDSLFTPAIAVDAAEDSLAPTETQRKTKIYKSRIDNIKTADKVIYTLNLDTYQQQSASKTITKEQKLNLRASGDIHILFSPSLLTF